MKPKKEKLTVENFEKIKEKLKVGDEVTVYFEEDNKVEATSTNPKKPRPDKPGIDE